MNKKQKEFLWHLVFYGWFLSGICLAFMYFFLLIIGTILFGLIIFEERLISELGLLEKSGLVTLGLTVLYWIIRFIKYYIGLGKEE